VDMALIWRGQPSGRCRLTHNLPISGPEPHAMRLHRDAIRSSPGRTWVITLAWAWIQRDRLLVTRISEAEVESGLSAQRHIQEILDTDFQTDIVHTCLIFTTEWVAFNIGNKKDPQQKPLTLIGNWPIINLLLYRRSKKSWPPWSVFLNLGYLQNTIKLLDTASLLLNLDVSQSQANQTVGQHRSFLVTTLWAWC
jgi:hypothetical protein